MRSLLITVRVYVIVGIEQAHETLHRFRLRHSRSYRVAWVHTMREFRAECQANDALARALAQVEYDYAYRAAR